MKKSELGREGGREREGMLQERRGREGREEGEGRGDYIHIPFKSGRGLKLAGAFWG